MVGSASRVVLGVSDVEATAAFLHALGLEPARDGLELRPASRARSGGPYDRGPMAIDVYTRDASRSAELAAESGARVGPIGTVELGPLRMRQVRAFGPDGVPIVFVESNRRRASVLDEPDGAARLHSGVHSVVWGVDDLAAEAAWWVERGATRGPVTPVTHPEVGRFLELPRADAGIVMTMLSDADCRAIRLELFEFTDEPGATSTPGPDSLGIQALVFPGLPSATSPGGVRIEGEP